MPLRLTWQATPRNKFNIFWDEQKMCLECEAGGSPTVAPEASGGTWDTDFQRFHQMTWTSPMTSRLLAEAGYRADPHEVWTAEPERRSHSGHGTGRRHPGVDLSIRRLAPESRDGAPLARRRCRTSPAPTA